MTKEQQVEKVRERVRLTDEEISVAIIQATPFPDTRLEERRIIAEAQLNKMLSDSDILIRDEDQRLPEWKELYASVRGNLAIPSYIEVFMRELYQSIDANFVKVIKA